MQDWLLARIEYLFLDVLMSIVAVVSAIYCIKSRLRFKSMRYFFLYPITSALQTVSYLILDPFMTTNTSGLMTSISSIIFFIIEYSSIGIFYYVEVSTRKKKREILFIIFGYTLFVLSLVLTINIDSAQSFIFKSQSFVIILFVAAYIRDLFRIPPKSDLLNEPAYWITISSLLISLGMTPVIVSYSFIFDNELLVKELFVYALNFILYIFSFCLIIRACFCKPSIEPIEKIYTPKSK